MVYIENSALEVDIHNNIDTQSLHFHSDSLSWTIVFIKEFHK